MTPEGKREKMKKVTKTPAVGPAPLLHLARTMQNGGYHHAARFFLKHGVSFAHIQGIAHGACVRPLVPIYAKQAFSGSTETKP